MNRALEIVSRVEELGGSLALDGEGGLRYRIPKHNPESPALVEAIRAERQNLLAFLRMRRDGNGQWSLAEKEKSAFCGSPHCAGCYDVGEGRKIHPPKIGEAYKKWLEDWEPKGSRQ
jgi:hypothetical protein